MKIIGINPIGIIHNNIKTKQINWDDVESEIILFKEFIPLISGLEDYSHIEVIFWMHKVSIFKASEHKIDNSLKKVGSFASRTQFRPNPIGLTVAEIVKLNNTGITVKGLDAFDKSPVLDIKPYSAPSRSLIYVRTPDRR